MTEKEINFEITTSIYRNIISFKKNIFYVDNFQGRAFLEIIQFIKQQLDSYKEIIVCDKVIIAKEVIREEIDLSNCTFKKDCKVIQSNFHNTVTIKKAKFEGETSFKKTTFQSKTRFHESIFNLSVDFENTTFNALADFYAVTFMSPQRFFLTDFLNVTIFSNSKFENQVQFIYNKVNEDSIISFESACFKQSIDISRSNFWCKLQFWGSVFDRIIPVDTWLYEFDSVEKKETSKLENSLTRVRESYRMIKHSFRQEGNSIESLKLHQMELTVFKSEKSLIKINNFLSTWRPDKLKKIQLLLIQIEEGITIWFNYLSNNFGQSWFRGVIFSLAVSYLFFLLLILNSEEQFEVDFSLKTILLTSKYFIQFLNITNWEYQPYGIDLLNGYDLGYLILFIGRIFTGYGFYQTIQAFRKFGKN